MQASLYLFFVLYVHTASEKEVFVAKKGGGKEVARQEMSAVERLGLRVSSMINHPIAQERRWVKVHRLDTDGDAEWEQVMGVLSETDEIDMTFEDDGSVTLKWEARSDDDRPVADDEVDKLGRIETLGSEAPF